MKNALQKNLFILLVLTLVTFYNAIGQSGLCDSTVPFSVVNLTSSPNATWTSANLVRQDYCCTIIDPTDRCLEFEVTLHPDAVAINFFIASGATPGGSGFYQINCGPSIPAGQAVCVSGVGPHTITYCKPGNNANTYTIESFQGIAAASPVTISENCGTTLSVTGLVNESTVTWTDITSGTGQYNALLSCTVGCASTIFTADGTNLPSQIQYQVCGVPDAGECSSVASEVCDIATVYIVERPEFTIPSQEFCENSINSYSITSVLISGTSGYTYSWYSGSVGSGTLITSGTDLTSIDVTASGNYYLTVENPIYGSCTASTQSFSVLVKPLPVAVINGSTSICSGTPLTFSAQNAGAGASYAWYFGSGAVPPSTTGIGPHTVTYGSCTPKDITLSIDLNGCLASTSLSIPADTEPPMFTSFPADVDVECDAIPAIEVPMATDNCDNNVNLNMVETTSPGSCGGSYSILRTWTATDNCNITTTSTQTINVLDTDAPVVDPIPDLGTYPCYDDIPAPDINVVTNVVDECGSSSTVNHVSDGPNPGCSGTVIRTYSVTDACGNVVEVSQNIYINDDSVPTADPLADMGPYACYADIPAPNISLLNTAGDNCGLAPTVTHVSDSPNPGCSGTVIRTYRVTDNCGNFIDVPQNILVNDDVNPTASPIPAIGPFACYDDIPTPNGGDVPSVADNCGQLPTVTHVSDSPDPGCTGTVVRTYRVEDNCGNFIEVTQDIQINDNINPTADPLNDLGPFDCFADIPAPNIADVPNPSDNCGLAVTVTHVSDSGNPGCNGTVIRTYRVEDACGNFIETTQNIIISDDFNPTANPLPDMGPYACYQDIPAPDVSLITGETDNCGLAVTVTHVSDDPNPGCSGTVIRTYRVQDNCGNAIDVLQNIYINDDSVPTADPLADMGPYACYADIPAPNISLLNTAGDNCGLAPTVTHVSDSPNPGCSGTVIRTYRVTDNCGNFIDVPQNILVNDDVNPTASPIPAIGPFACYDDIPTPNGGDVPNVADNCGQLPTVTHVSDSPDPGCTGTVVRTYRVEDNCGNFIEVTQDIQINDNVNPTADPLNDLGPFDCFADIPAPNIADVPNPSDNCGLAVTVTHVSDSGNPGCNGTVIRTYRVEDACGNFIETTQNIIISDDFNPTANPLPDMGPYACYQDIPAPDVSLITGETDNCGLAVTVTHVSDDPNPGCSGTVIRTYRVQDNCGNAIDVLQNIYINDDSVPTADPLADMGPYACYADIPAPNISLLNTAGDNCGLAPTVTHVSDSPNPGCSGTVIRTYRVTDNCGNFIDVPQNILVNDDVNPTASPIPAIGPFACYDDIPTANGGDVPNVADNCGQLPTVTHVSDSPDPGCTGTVVRTYRVEDNCGNFIEVTQDIQINDNINPTADPLNDLGPFDCYADIPAPNIADVPNPSDNCGLAVTVTHVSDSGNPGCNGTVIRTYRVEDACGNFIETTQNIIISDDFNPTANPLPDMGPYACYQDIPAPDVSLITGEIDNCGLAVTVTHVSDDPNPGCSGTVIRTYRVQDNCGNAIDVLQNIYINDDSVPTADPLADMGPYACYADIPAPNISLLNTAGDNCGLAPTVTHVSDSPNPGCSGTVIRTYRVTDNCGNFIDVPQNILVNDDVNPTASPIPAIGPFACYADIPAPNGGDVPSVADNCGQLPTVTHVSDSPDPGCMGTVVRTYRVEDNCGNFIEVTQDITINDDVNPTAGTIPDLGPFPCYADIPAPNIADVPNPADNCGLAVTVTHVSDSGNPGCTGTVTRTYRIEDVCGNFVQVTQNILIEDDVDPTADPLPDLGPYACYQDIPAPNIADVQNEMDNCGLDVTVTHVSDSPNPGCSGDVTRTYRVEDNCGNFISLTQNITIDDNVNPTADLLPDLGPYACYADMPAPSITDVQNASDNCGLAVIVTHVSDSSDPGCMGDVTRTYRVQDMCGNFIEVTQNITINDDVDPTAGAIPAIGPYACYADIPAPNGGDVPSVADNCGQLPTVTHVSDSPDPGCMGTVVRTYRVEDNCGNFIEVTQDITINDDVNPTAGTIPDLGPFPCYADIPAPNIADVPNPADNCGLAVTVTHMSDSGNPGCTGTVTRTYRIEDVCGNFVQVTQNILIEDDVDPTADPLPDLGPYACYQDIPAPNIADVQNEMDNCGLDVTVTHVSDSPNPGCSGDVTRTYRVEDNCGNFISLTQNITIDDNVNPTADLLPDLGPYACYADMPAPSITDVQNASDNCGLAVIVTHVSDSPDPGCMGDVTRTYRVQDMCGNFIEVTQNITINDDVDPTAGAIPAIGPYACYADIPAPNGGDVPSVADNCGQLPTVTHVSDSPDPGCMGTVVRTYRVEDNCGNFIEVTQDITINDDVNPTAGTIPDLGPFPCYADIPAPNIADVPNPADNCGLAVTVTHVSDSGNPGCTGTVTRTYRIEDVCGNFVQVTQNILIEDDVDPTADPLPDLGPYACYQDIPAPNIADVQNEMDNCGLDVTVTHVSDSPNPGCSGDVTRTYRVEDNCGNFISLTQNITIDDNVNPTADLLPDLGPYACYADMPAPSITDVQNASDNCGLAVIVTHVSDSPDPGCMGDVTRTYRVQDMCGNFIEVTQNITINDDVDPTAGAIPAIGPYACYADIPAPNGGDVPSVADNCGQLPTVTHVSDSPDPGCMGTVVRTYRVEDNCGNFIEVTQDITINDDVNPTAGTIPDLGPFPCYADIPAPNIADVPNPADNCGLAVTVTHVSDSGNPGCTGTVTRTYRIEDVCGNFVQVTQNILIEDDVDPTADPLPDLGPYACYQDIPAPNIADVQNEMDNCGLDVTVTHVSDSPNPGCSGDVTRTYRVEDNCGNFISLTQNITIDDNVNPTADLLPDLGPYACYADMPAPSITDVQNASDNCGLAVIVTHVSDSPDPGCMGDVTRTYRVQDMCGNFIEVTQNITINDDVDPTAGAIPAIGPFACYADIPAPNGGDVPSVADNCGQLPTVTHVSDSPDPGCMGTVVRTYRVEDNCGNFIEVTQDITINDDVNPTAGTIPDLGPFPCYADIPAPNIADVPNPADNCGLAVTVTHVSDSGNPGCTGTVTRTYRIEDVCGNFIQVTQNILIEDDVDPTADPLPDLGPYACYQDIPAPNIADVQNEMDNCGLDVTVTHVSDSPNPGCSGDVTRTYRVEDNCGNFISLTQNITIDDNVNPTADLLPDLGPYACYADMPAPSITDVQNASDNCGLAVIVTHVSDSPDPGCMGDVTRTYRVQDMCGNFIEVTQNITINDDVDPTAGAIPAIGPFACYADIPAPNGGDVPSVADNCGQLPTVTHVSDSPDPGCMGTVVRTYRVEDNCGNFIEVTQDITINDDVNPTAGTIPDLGPFPCYADIPAPNIADVPNPADNCGLAVTVTHVSDSGNPGCTGTVTRTYRIEDVCGNFVQVTQNILIEDDVDPTADLLPDLGPYACYQDIPAPNIADVQNEMDNCGLDVTVTHVSDSPNPGCSGDVTRTYRVEDNCGNFISLTQNITIDDNVNPTADLLPDLGPYTCASLVPAPSIASVQNASDNCGLAVIVTHVSDVGDTECMGTIIRTYRVQDMCGNFIELTQNIAVNDDVPPTASPIPDLGPFACYNDIPAPNIGVVPNPSDNCGDAVTVTHVSDGPDPGCMGTVIRTYRIEDVCGNFIETTQNILIEDDVPPTASPIPTVGPFPCYADIPAPNIADVPNPADNCGLAVTVTHVSDSGNPGCSGTVIRTYRIEDVCGNFAEVAQNILIDDQTLPTADAIPAIGPYACYRDIPEPNPADVPNVLDNCGLDVTVTHVSDSGNPGCIGTVVRTYRVEDNCGNFILVTQDITINDDVLPTASPLPDLGPFTCINLIPAPSIGYVQNEMDNCITSVIVSHVSDVGDNECMGTIVRTYRVQDMCGNFIELTQNIFVNDDVPPTANPLPDLGPFSCYANIPAPNSAVVNSEMDNCNGAVVVSFVSDGPDPGCSGTVVRIYRLEDMCGNVSEISQNIIINDNTPPTASPLADIGPFPCYEDIPAPNPADVLNPSDNCGLQVTVTHVSDSPRPLCLGLVVRTYRIEDVCGNFTNITQNILINDNVRPTTDPLPNLGPFVCYADIPPANIADVQNVMDNCGEPVTVEHLGDSPYPGCMGDIFRSYKVEDICGNYIVLTQVISINDNVDPTADPLPDLGPFSCLSEIPAPNPDLIQNATDNCGEPVTIIHTSDEVSSTCEGIVVRTYRVEDPCGNFIEITQNISFNDQTAPTANALPDLGPFICMSDIPAPDVAVVQGETDNCGGVPTVTFVEEVPSESCVGTIVRTYQIEDLCGNMTTLSQNIILNDTEAPDLEISANDVTISCQEDTNPENLINAWLADHGGAIANNPCGEVTWTNDYQGYTELCGNTIEATVTFTFADECNNTGTTTATFAIVDNTAPSILNAPEDITVECANIPDPPQIITEDNCGNVRLFMVEDEDNGPCVDIYTLTRTWTATDDCDNSSSMVQVITVINCGPSLSMNVEPNTPICADESATFSVNLSAGYDTPVYQWEVSTHEGFSWEEIPGATAATYTIENADQYDTGWYRVRVANSINDLNNDGCHVLSDYAVLEVYPIIEPLFLTRSICEGESFTVGTTDYNATGIYEQTLIAANGCDSLVTLDLSVYPHQTTELTESICDGESFIVGNTAYAETGIYTKNLQTSHGCDSVITLNLTVIPRVNSSFNESICAGESYTFGNNDYTTSGNFTQTFISSSGCDSVVTLFLNVVQPKSKILNRQICTNETYTVGNQTFDATGTYQIPLTSAAGCDSIVTLNLEILDNLMSSLNKSICEGEIFQINGFTYSEAGTYQVPFISSGGCDSTVVLTLETSDVLVTFLEESICAGESITIGNTPYFNTGSWSETLVSSSGCDSIVNLDLYVDPKPVINLQETICNGDVYTVGNSAYGQSGNYSNILTTQNGCDSTINLSLTVMPPHNVNIDTTICEGQIIMFDGLEFSQAGVHLIDFIDDNGCDATTILTITAQEPIQTNLNAMICTGQSYTLGNQTFNTAGTYNIPLQTQQYGCDSLVVLNLSVSPGLTTTLNERICQGESFAMGGQIYNTSGTYTAELTALAGCDSTVTLNLEVLDEIDTNLVESICEGDSFTIGTTAYSESGLYVNVLTSSDGCDSIVSLDLNVLPEVITEITEEICGGEVYAVGGQTFNQTGSYNVILNSINGCDSTINLNLIVHSQAIVNRSEAICEGQSITIGSTTLTQAGNYSLDLQTEAGCDSVINLTLTVEPGLETVLNETICEGESFAMGGNTYDETGTYRSELTAQGDCDSTVTLHLLVVDVPDINLTETICEGSSFAVGTSVYTETGIYQNNLTTTSGCDSMVILDLTVLPATSSILKEEICEGESFVIQGQVFNQTGEYVVSVPTSEGCDSLVYLDLKVFPEVDVTRNEAICSGQIIEIGDQSFSTSGVYQVRLSTPQGCDSTITLVLTVEPGLNTTLNEEICLGQSYQVGSETFAESGTYVVELLAEAGCDSTVTLHLDVLDEINTNLVENICEGESYAFNEMIYTETGIYTQQLVSSGGCDSIVTLDLTVNEVLMTSLNEEICQGETVVIGNETFFQTGIYSVNFVTPTGCDSTVTLDLTVFPSQFTTLNETICTGQSFDMGGQTYSSAGTYTAQLQNVAGCDSTVTLNLNIQPGLNTTLNESICLGQSFDMGGQTYTEAGTYTANLTAAAGCDSTVTLNLQIVEEIMIDLVENICHGDSFTMGTTDYDATGTYTETFISSGGCDSTVILNLTVLEEIINDLDESICAGTSFTVGNSTYSESGVYENLLTSPDGCDSLVRLNLTILPVINTTLTEQICQGETVVIGNETFFQTGIYSIDFVTPTGCDSTVTLDLTVFPSQFTTLNETICVGQSFDMGGQTYSTSGTYTAQLQNVAGCDSTVTLNLNIQPGLNTTLNESICLGQSFNMGGQTYTEAGTYTANLTAAAGCDSTVTLNLQIVEEIMIDLVENICHGNSFTMGTTDYDATGTYTETFISSGGCDSTVTLNLTVLEEIINDLDESICAGTSFTVGNSTYSESGVYENLLTSPDGCDSLVRLNLTILPVINTTLTEQICQGETVVIGNETFFQTGIYSIDFVTPTGCDSTVTLDLTVFPSQFTTLNETICVGQSFDMGGQTYSSAGTYTAQLQNVAGCDSTVTLNLNVQNDIMTTLNESICLGQSFNMGGQTYTEAGTYTANLTAAAGCDSTVTLNLQIVEEIMIDLVENICHGDSFTMGTTDYDATGTYTETFISSGGCDSTVTLNLTVLEEIINDLDESICAGTSFTVGNSTYSESGVYENLLTSPDGCDSLVRLNLTILPVINTTLTEQICQGETVVIGNETFFQTGIYSIDFVTPTGCDSTVTLDLTVFPSQFTTLNETICVGQSFDMGGQTYSSAGTYTAQLQNVAGCDSTVTLNLNVQNDIMTTLNESICLGQSFNMGGQTYTEAGTYTANLTAAAGCDSTVTLNLQIVEEIMIDLVENICHGDSFTMGTTDYDATGTYTETFISSGGCDSTVTLNLTVLEEIINDLDESICAGTSFTVGNSTYSESGVYENLLTSPDGCDSLVRLNLTILPVINTTLTEQICQGETVVIGNETFFQTGIYSIDFVTLTGCDSTVTLDLTVFPSQFTTLNETICVGQSFDMGGQTYSTSGTYTAQLQNVAGCDSTVTLNLNVQNDIMTTLNESICLGQSFNMGGQTYTEAGTYTANLTAAAGCDSTVTLNLQIVEEIMIDLVENICHGDSFTMGTTDYDATGTYTETFISSGGCDSTVTLNLTVLEEIINDLDESICAGTSFTVGNSTYSESGVYENLLTSSDGCDSLVRLNLTVIPTTNSQLIEQICEGESFIVGTETFEETGTYTINFTTATDCDSIVTLELTVLESQNTVLDKAICTGQSFEMGGETYNETGIYTANLQTSTGCDSIVTLNLMVQSALTTTLDESICTGQTFEIGGQTYSETGTYTANLIAAAGCDSIVTLNLQVVEEINTNLTEEICEGSSITIGNNEYSETGIFTTTLFSSGGCDSIVTLDLTVYTVPMTDLVEQVCEGSSITIGNETFNETGTYSIILESFLGCDSIVSLDLMVLTEVNTFLNQAICTGQTVEMGGEVYSETGMYIANLQTTTGCDSIVTLELMVEEGLSTSLNEIICEGQNFVMGGETYDQTGTYTANLIAEAGCDSIVTLNLQVLESIQVTLTEQICTGQTFEMAGQTYAETGLYMATIPSVNGCDSLITLDLTVVNALTTELSVEICTNETPPVIGGTTYDQTGEYTITLVSEAGCDSLVQLSLIVHASVNTSLEETICAGESFEMGGQTYTETGTYISNLVTEVGCDSTVTLNLIVENTNNTSLAEAICEGESITIGTETFTTTGTYTIDLVTSSGCDSIVTLDLTVHPSLTATQVAAEICDGESYTIGSETFTATGTYSVQLMTEIGCDSTINLDLTVLPPIELSSEDQTICEGDEVQLEVFTNSENAVTWSPSTGLSCTECLDPIASPTSTTTYTFSTTNCDGSTLSATVTVVVEYPPSLTLSATDMFLIPGKATTVSAITDNNNVTINWYNETNNLVCESCPVFAPNPEISGVYTAVASTPAGCENSSSVEFTVVGECEYNNIEIPNFISPNKDGRNDYFEIRYEGFFTINVVRIYNRWGEKVFETNDVSQFWDGKYKGKDLNSGVFLYYIEGECFSGEHFIKKGNVTLIQ